jgi:acyl carrier protein
MQSLYDRVVAFVAKQRGVRADRLKPETTLFGDLGTDGDDGVELLEEFGREFSVDMSGCDARRYFGSEGLPPWFLFYWIILAFRRGTSEERARLKPIRIADLVRSAELGRWAVDNPPLERTAAAV